MSSFRAFLDHWETQIKRNFGIESDEINVFKKATGKEFDNNFSYRFTYDLRNLHPTRRYAKLSNCIFKEREEHLGG